MRFELIVIDAFRLGDGRTLFTCEAVSAPRFIRACECILQLDGERVSVVRLEGENLPDPNRTGLRVVGTQASVVMDPAKLKTKAYRLVCDDQQT